MDLQKILDAVSRLSGKEGGARYRSGDFEIQVQERVNEGKEVVVLHRLASVEVSELDPHENEGEE